MKKTNRLKNLLEIDLIQHDGTRGIGNQRILEAKGDQIHMLLIFISIIYAFFFSLFNILNRDIISSIINFSAIPLGMLAYLFFRMGYIKTSKVINLIQVSTVIFLLSMFINSKYGSHDGDSTLLFIVPVIIGTLIAFQGKERIYGYVLSVCIFVILMLLISFDFHLGDHPPYSPDRLRIEFAINLIGAIVATAMEIVFILVISNKIDEKLIKTNMELDNFVYSVSHDLRSPVVSVRGLMGLVLENERLEPVVRQYLQMGEKSLLNLDDTIREILEYSRNTRLASVKEKFDLEPMAEKIFSDLRYLAGDQMNFKTDFENGSEIYTDKSRMNTVIRNVISNAVKYRKKGIQDPYVCLRLLRNSKHVIIEVEDNGEGISAANLSKVFDMFYRGTTTSMGTGLGLYICKEILGKMNGTISISSELGKGTIVKIEIDE